MDDTSQGPSDGRLAPRSSSSSLRRALTAQSFDDHATCPPGATSSPPDKPKPDADVEKGEKDELEDAGSLEEPAPKTVDAAEASPDRHKITWQGRDDPQNPKNWPTRKKWAAAVVVSSFTFISPVSSSMVAPALMTMSEELGIKTQFESAMVLSIFVLAYAVGPLFLGPLSEIYGRVKILQLTNVMYLVWNLACGFAKTGPQILVFRFLSGFGGSAPLAIGGAVIGDCFAPEQRGRAISMYSLAPLLGPAVGPIVGGFITEKTTWRWIFWATTILDAVIQLFGIFYLQETYAPVLLQRKAAQRRKETGDDAYYTEFDNHDSIITILGQAFVRPFRLLFTQPIIQAIAAYMAFLYGMMYLMLSTFPTLWSERYGESVGTASLNYIALGVGFFLGAQISAPVNDKVYRRLKELNNGVGRPEFRTPGMFVGACLIPIGLFWYGWAAEARAHWILPDIGAAIFCAGAIMGFQSMQMYIVDSYARFAASGIAAAVVLRSTAGFGFPLFAPAMYAKLGYGWGNTILGVIAILGLPAPILFWKFGEKMRTKSKFAAG